MSLAATAPDLRALFEPDSVAVIGASSDPRSISARPLRMLQQHGFRGRVYPVNPRYDELLGLKVYPTIGAIPERVDLALVIVPAPVVVQVLEQCAAAGVGCAMVITSGFAESSGVGEQLQRDIARLAARTGLRVCGPNSEGVYHPTSGLCATFSPAVDPEHGFLPDNGGGPIAVVSQSGGLAFALFNHAQDRGLGVGAVVSSGNEVDVGWADYVDYLLDQDRIRVVLSFVESIRQPDRLVDVARKAARLRKPLVIAKIGRTDAGRRAAASHTGSLVGPDAAYSAVFGQLGIIRVDDVDEMMDLATYFSLACLPTGRSAAALTASGGAGAWLADACATRGLEFPAPDAADQRAIQAFIPEYGSVRNPVDITAQAALSGGFERALGILAHSPRFAIVLGVVTLVREERFFETLPDLRQALEGSDSVVVYYSYTRGSPATTAALAKMGVPCYSTPARTARALQAAVEYAEFLGRAESLAVFTHDQHAREQWPAPGGPLSEAGARAYLAPLGIPSPNDHLARSADEAQAAFVGLGGQPVALKVQSSAVPHKSDVGGVRLHVRTEADVRAAFDDIMAGVRQASPEASIEGVLVQAMTPIDGAGVEVFLAARRQPLVGPLVVVGLGGVDVESTADIAMRLAPVSPTEARAMIDDLRGRVLLHGSRRRPPVDIDALVDAIVRMSELAAGLPPTIRGVELNPLLVREPGQGVLMLDAAIELEETNEEANEVEGQITC